MQPLEVGSDGRAIQRMTQIDDDRRKNDDPAWYSSANKLRKIEPPASAARIVVQVPAPPGLDISGR